jgi:hypothetical protein
MASSGTLPRAGDVVRIDRRAVPELPVGAWLWILRVERARTIVGWAYLTVLVAGVCGPCRVLVPVSSVTVYPGRRS